MGAGLLLLATVAALVLLAIIGAAASGVLGFGAARPFFAGVVAFTNSASSLGPAVGGFVEVIFLVFTEALAMALALVAAVSLGAAAMVSFITSFIACAFFGRVVETWRAAPWQRGAAIRVPMGAATIGPAFIQLLAHRESICVFSPSRDMVPVLVVPL